MAVIAFKSDFKGCGREKTIVEMQGLEACREKKQHLLGFYELIQATELTHNNL